MSGAQDLAGLGIGFVQSISDSGMTETQITGKATFDGDWVGTVQASHDEKIFKPDNGAATLTADFDKDEFMGVLTGLATLEGTFPATGSRARRQRPSRTLTWSARPPSRACSKAASTARRARKPAVSSTSRPRQAVPSAAPMGGARDTELTPPPTPGGLGVPGPPSQHIPCPTAGRTLSGRPAFFMRGTTTMTIQEAPMIPGHDWHP